MMPGSANRGLMRMVVPGQLSLFDTGAEGIVLYRLLKPRTPSWHMLIEQNEGLVYSRIKHIIGVTPGNFDDLMQAGRIALMNAAKKYNLNLGFQFSTYAVPAIDRAMFREQKRLLGKLEVQSCGEMGDEFLSGLIKATVPDVLPYQSAEENEMVEMLMRIAGTALYENERKGIRALARHLQGCGVKSIAREAGIAVRSYTALISEGRKALKNNPRLLSYVAMLKGEKEVAFTASLRGEVFTLMFGEDSSVNIPQLENITGIMEREEVADYLLCEVKIGDKAYILEEDSTITSFAMGLDSIQILAAERFSRTGDAATSPRSPRLTA